MTDESWAQWQLERVVVMPELTSYKSTIKTCFEGFTDLEEKNVGECKHEPHLPEYDSDAAQGMESKEVKKRWPRFHGECSSCGQRVILYASWEHYLHGDW